MSPTAALQHAIDAAVTASVAVGSRYQTIQAYIAQGRPIPDDLLPGRLLARQPSEVRAALRALTSAAAANVAPWAVRDLVG